MSMTATDLNDFNDVVSSLRRSWENMTSEQRSMVKTLVELISADKTTRVDESIASLYRPLSREEMLASIDLGIAQIERGEGQTLEEVGAELDAEFGFAP